MLSVQGVVEVVGGEDAVEVGEVGVGASRFELKLSSWRYLQ